MVNNQGPLYDYNDRFKLLKLHVCSTILLTHVKLQEMNLFVANPHFRGGGGRVTLNHGGELKVQHPDTVQSIPSQSAPLYSPSQK